MSRVIVELNSTVMYKKHFISRVDKALINPGALAHSRNYSVETEGVSQTIKITSAYLSVDKNAHDLSGRILWFRLVFDVDVTFLTLFLLYSLIDTTITGTVDGDKFEF